MKFVIKAKDENELDGKEIDKIWGERNKTDILRQVKKASLLAQKSKDEDTPIELLEAALKKLEHENLLPQNIRISDADEAIKILNKIKATTECLKATFWEIKKGPKKLKEKFDQ